ncbi:MAG: uroporphyrinogen decarboxylase family protein [Armatimonadota bacterium]
MNQRERWLATMHFQPVDHVPDEEFGYWSETFPLWHAQGLPEYINDNWKADIYFGFETRLDVPVNLGIIPGFEYKVLEEDDRHKTILDYDGVTKVVGKSGHSSIPKFLKFPIESRADWDEFKKRLDLSTSSRFLQDNEWQVWKSKAQASDKPVGIPIGSLFGWIRDWMGFENICYMIMDDPGLIQDIMEHLTNFILTQIERSVTEMKLDYAAMWEDMCYNHGPILQPKHFEEWMVPRLKRITSFLKDHGCDVVYVDCDGNINELVSMWLDAGVNCMFPLEMRGGTDAVKLREKYGHRVLLAGGVDKTALIAGKDEIKKEIARLKPVVDDGGFIPHVDHRCPPDVTFENYLYYLKLKRDTFGIPEPEPWDSRKDRYNFA